ncbi:glycosyltransferase family 4 protein [Halobellus limi]|uniref:Glycosyltransferase family 1 protein n=1 Tax=Halobellus limi TaxID=699433 RepID=A0A1H5TYQ5_9EURY|nr:glycosyltransferase family 1 protein [Halobellus limi]QCC47199.1 glycosyltransferase family 1 protein [Halobellus limi]SEF67860.1 Glycosyltransferase involved in cell wall bisynthesis [Halobellus limi]
MTDPLRVHFFTLTDTNASEHIYMSSLRDALTDRDVVAVDDWREADVVHLFEVNFYSRAALSEFEYLTLFRMLRSDTPVVVSTDDLFFLDRPELTARPGLYPLNHLTQTWLFDSCDRIIAISESVKAALRKEFPESKIDVVRHGVDARYRADETTPTDDEPFVLHVSLAAKRKNPAAIVEAAERLDRRFVIAGSGWDEHIPDRPETENVEIRGYVPEDELVDLYERAAVFYFPTLHEGFGLPVLEAMAAGCAVVASDVYSVPEVAGDAAILCDPHDTDAHVEAIERLLEDETERKALSTRARERAWEFSWERAAEETMNIYRDLT